MQPYPYAGYPAATAAVAHPQYWSPANSPQSSPRAGRNGVAPRPAPAVPIYRPAGAPTYPMNFYPAMPRYGGMPASPGYMNGQPIRNPMVAQPGAKGAQVPNPNVNSNDPRRMLASNPEAFDAMNDKKARVKLAKKYIVKVDPSALKDDDDDDEDLYQYPINAPLTPYPVPPQPPVQAPPMPMHHHGHIRHRSVTPESDCSICLENSCPECRHERRRRGSDDCSICRNHSPRRRKEVEDCAVCISASKERQRSQRR